MEDLAKHGTEPEFSVALVETLIDNAIKKAVEYLNKRCQTCGSGLIKYKEFSPDRSLPFYFCSKHCYKKWRKESGLAYRASPLEEL